MKQAQETTQQPRSDFSDFVNAASDDFDTDLVEDFQPCIYALPARAFRFVDASGWPLDA